MGDKPSIKFEPTGLPKEITIKWPSDKEWSLIDVMYRKIEELEKRIEKLEDE